MLNIAERKSVPKNTFTYVTPTEDPTISARFASELLASNTIPRITASTAWTKRYPIASVNFPDITYSLPAVTGFFQTLSAVLKNCLK